jgi:hypothetical protein
LKNDGVSPVFVRLLGAPATGKTQLAAQLRAALPAFTIDDDPLPALSLAPDSYGLVLLMGLDLPAPGPDAVREAADQALRLTLAQAGMAFQVVYGHGAQRLQNALRALQAGLPQQLAPDRPAKRIGNWVWTCDNCSDPQCERRLLSDLLAARASPP